MNKKTTVTVIVSLAVFVIISISVLCVTLFKKPSEDDYDEHGEETLIIPETLVYDDVISEPIYDNMPEGIYYRTVTKKTVLNTDNGSRMVYFYPEFEGFDGLNKDTELNSLIKEHMTLMQRMHGGGLYKMIEHGAKATYDITSFEITYIDDSFISIVFFGSFYAIGDTIYIDTGSRNFAYSLNIDIEAMKTLDSSDLISDFLALRSSFLNGELKMTVGADDLLKNTTYSEIFGQYRSEYEIYPDIYFTFERVNVIISLTSDLGGAAVFSDTKEGSRDYINTFLSPLTTYYS